MSLNSLDRSQCLHYRTIRANPLILQPRQPWLEAHLLGATRALFANRTKMLISCQMCPQRCAFGGTFLLKFGVWEAQKHFSGPGYSPPIEPN